MQSDSLPTDEEMIKWAGIEYEGGEVPIQLRRLIWAARTQGKKIAWRDAYQIAAQQVYSYDVGLPDVKSSESAKD